MLIVVPRYWRTLKSRWAVNQSEAAADPSAKTLPPNIMGASMIGKNVPIWKRRRMRRLIARNARPSVVRIVITEKVMTRKAAEPLPDLPSNIILFPGVTLVRTAQLQTA